MAFMKLLSFSKDPVRLGTNTMNRNRSYVGWKKLLDYVIQ